MTVRQAIPLGKAHILLNHGPVTLISSAYQGKRSVMAASWVMPLDFSPAKIIAVINSQAYTRELLEASGEFVISIPSKAMASKVLSVGGCSGRDIDKFAKFEIATLTAENLAAPLIDGCVGWLACRVVSEPHNQQRYDLFIGEVLAAWADPDVLQNGKWTFPNEDHKTIHYVSEGQFFTTGDAFKV